jgi:hypothetical protein
MSVRLSVCISAASTGRIPVKFDIGDFYEKCAEIYNGSPAPGGLSNFSFLSTKEMVVH